MWSHSEWSKQLTYQRQLTYEGTSQYSMKCNLKMVCAFSSFFAIIITSGVAHLILCMSQYIFFNNLLCQPINILKAKNIHSDKQSQILSPGQKFPFAFSYKTFFNSSPQSHFFSPHLWWSLWCKLKSHHDVILICHHFIINLRTQKWSQGY